MGRRVKINDPEAVGLHDHFMAANTAKMMGRCGLSTTDCPVRIVPSASLGGPAEPRDA